MKLNPLTQYKNFDRLAVFIASLILLILVILNANSAIAQSPTATSVQLVVPTLTATEEKRVTPTPSKTATETGLGLARVEAKSAETGANLRAAPSTESEKLGTIFPGQFFGVIGRSNKWLQIQYDKSPNGRAWVYEDIVNITGLDPAQIPSIDQTGVPSPNVSTGAAQETANYLTQTPGAPQTATVLQSSATGIFTPVGGGGIDGPTSSVPLPTFTFPPPVIEATLPSPASTSTNQGGVPPIVPIIALAGLGLFGLFISGLRRL